MSRVALAQLQAATRGQALLRLLAFALPWLAATCVLAARVGGWAWALAGAAAALLVARALRQWRALDPDGIARALDARYPALEDSSALLLQDAPSLGPLAQLQRARVASRLAALSPPPRLAPPLPWRALAVNAVAALAAAAALAWISLPAPESEPASVPVATTTAPLPPGLRVASLRVQPPAYTHLPATEVQGLSARVPEGATVQWQLRAQGEPSSVVLRFNDGATLPLVRSGDGWTVSRRIDRAVLYRVRIAGRDTPWQRLGVIVDRPPRLRVVAPERSLSLIEPGQARWSVDVEASDDYGLAGAQLRVTLAQGSGENIQVSAREIALAGQGDARTRRYRHTLDLAALGFAAGDDLVVRLSVADNRAPAPQRSQSPSFILRWPPERGAEASGVEGMVERTLPAYFRSQRQVIIDTEALLALRPRPPQPDFTTRSDAIGVDQRLLRLRYGQFLGQEDESGTPGEERDAGAPPAREDAATALVEQFGHIHDTPEAATLLDPQTRKLLKSALDAMWSAERELRSGRPQQALPHEYRALRFIKQVQQASRIYLARVGLEQAPVDLARRLGGKREGIAPSRLPPATAGPVATPPARQLWEALDGKDRRAALAAADALERSVGAEAEAADSLALLSALDAWRADPACARCVQALRARLWPRLPVAPAAIAPRAAGDARGRAYLDALAPESTP